MDIHDELLDIDTPDGVPCRAPRGPEEVTAAHIVMELCQEHAGAGLWRTVFRLRTVYGYAMILAELRRHGY